MMPEEIKVLDSLHELIEQMDTEERVEIYRVATGMAIQKAIEEKKAG